MNKPLAGFICLLISASAATVATAQIPQEDADNRIEKFENLTEPETGNSANTASSMEDMMFDVRRTEAFNLVSSGYRGKYEGQGLNSYAVFISNYQTGELTAERLIEAAIDAGDLAPAAIEDDSYVRAVDSQLSALSRN